MLTIDDARASYRKWADQHPDFASTVDEEQALTLYVAGISRGIELVMERMELPHG